jgi:PHD/YefM family antitoxin component YafN of YafNO toxin-antitoxin module
VFYKEFFLKLEKKKEICHNRAKDTRSFFMKTLSTREVKDQMSDVLNQVIYSHEKFKIARHSKEVAIIISIDEWNEIATILQRLEDEADIREAELAYEDYKKNGGVSFSELCKDLGIKEEDV